MGSASLIEDEVHDKELLALYVQVDGVLTDAYEVLFDIYDDSAGFSSVAILSKTVTSGDGNFATGCYGAYDTVDFWAPSSAYARARIKWRYKLEETDTEYTVVTRTFEVVATSVAFQAEQVPVLIQDIKDAGASSSYTNKQIRDAICEFRDNAERYCRQAFRTYRATKRIRGTGGRIMFLSEPMHGCLTIKVNSESDARDTDQFTFWTFEREDRRNPRIEWFKSTTDSIYYPSSSGVFYAGLVNTIAGVFGFVEPKTLEAPVPVQRAIVRGARFMLDDDDAGSRSQVAGGPLAGEETDGHSVQYAVSSGKSRGGMLSILKDPMIRDALDHYLAPISIAAPAVDVSLEWVP